MSSGFVTESEILEKRKKRQEEWEKVRNADDPEEVPEELVDCRSLYDRLQEQKQKRDFEYEEAHKLKNMIKGLDDDEIEFLDYIDRTKLAADRRKNIEEEKELNDYRNRVASLQEKSVDVKSQFDGGKMAKPKVVANQRPSQTKLLKGAIVVKTESNKRSNTDSDPIDNNRNKRSKDDNDSTNKPPRDKNKQSKSDDDNHDGDAANVEKATASLKRVRRSDEMEKSDLPKSAGLTCIGILPGLGCYDDSSSDEECSTDSETDNQCSGIPIDLLGRKILPREKEA